MSRKLALIRETHIKRRFGETSSRSQQRLCPLDPQADEVGMRRHARACRKSANDLSTGDACGLREVGDADLAFGLGVKVIANDRHRAGSNSRPDPFGRKIAVTLEQSPKKQGDACLPFQQGLPALRRHVQTNEFAIEFMIIDDVLSKAPLSAGGTAVRLFQCVRNKRGDG